MMEVDGKLQWVKKEGEEGKCNGLGGHQREKIDKEEESEQKSRKYGRE